MKKFEFDFTNEWKSAEYGFDFIKLGWFADTDCCTNVHDYFELSLTLLGFNFSLAWNSDDSDDSIGADEELQDLLNRIANGRTSVSMQEFINEQEKEKKSKKAVKKVAKKAAKKTKTTKKSK